MSLISGTSDVGTGTAAAAAAATTTTTGSRRDQFREADTDYNTVNELDDDIFLLTDAVAALRAQSNASLASSSLPLDSDMMSVASNTTTASMALNRGVGQLRLSSSSSSTLTLPNQSNLESPQVTAGISKFDVLLRYKNTVDSSSSSSSSSSNATTTPQSSPFEFETLWTPSFHHVGNNRCHVVCQMHAAEFNAAAASSVDRDAILDRVYTMVLSLQCVDVAIPRSGKFLVRRQHTTDSSTLESPPFARYWTELTKDQARHILHECLRASTPNAVESSDDVISVPSPSLSQNDDSAPITVTTIKSSATAATTVAASAAGPLTEPIRNDESVTNSSVVGIDEEKKRRRRSSLLRRSLSMTGDFFNDEKKRIAMRSSVVLQLQSFDVSCSDDEDNATDDDVKYVASGQTKDETKTNEVDTDAETKSKSETPPPKASPVQNLIRHGRRTSLVASMPSLSGTSLPVTASHNRGLLERSPSWSQGLDAAHQELFIANALDVIFQEPELLPDKAIDKPVTSRLFEYTLLANHTGNNRLLVMVQLRLSKYMSLVNARTMARQSSASIERVRQLCRDLVEAVHASYKGRFLLENVQTESGDTESYRLMSVEQATTALECIFQAEAAVEEDLNATTAALAKSASETNAPHTTNDGIIAASVGSKPVSLAHSMSSIPTTFNVGLGGLGSRSSSLSTNASGDVHRAAIESLQKLKKRQGVNNKISKMVAFNTGNSSLLECSRSAEDAMASAKTPTLPPDQSRIIPQPLLHNNSLSRFGSTGMSLQQVGGGFPSSYSSFETMPAEAVHLQQQLQQHQLQQHQHQQHQLQQQLQQQQHHEQQQSVCAGNDTAAMYEYQPMNHSSVTWDMSLQEQQQLQMQQQQIHYSPFNAPQLQQQRGASRRRSALSEFSQGMIHDMLRRLESGNENYEDGSGAANNAMMIGHNSTIYNQGNAFVGNVDQNIFATSQYHQQQSDYPNQLFAMSSGDVEGGGVVDVSADGLAATNALGFGYNQRS